MSRARAVLLAVVLSSPALFPCGAAERYGIRIRLEDLRGQIVRDLRLSSQFDSASTPADDSGIVLLPLPKHFTSGELLLSIEHNDQWAVLSPPSGRLAVVISRETVETVTVVRRGDLDVLKNSEALSRIFGQVLSELEAVEQKTIERAFEAFAKKLSLDPTRLASVVNPQGFARELESRDSLLEALSGGTDESIRAARDFLLRIRTELPLTESMTSPIIQRLLQVAFDSSDESELAVTAVREAAPGALGRYLADRILGPDGEFFSLLRIESYDGLDVERREFTRHVLEKAHLGDVEALRFLTRYAGIVAPALSERGRSDVVDLLLSVGEATDEPRSLRVDALREVLPFLSEDPWSSRRSTSMAGIFDPTFEALVGIARETVGSVRAAAFRALVTHATILHPISWPAQYDASLDSIRRVYDESSLVEKMEMTAPICDWLALRDTSHLMRDDERWLLHTTLTSGAVLAADLNRCLPGFIRHLQYIQSEDLDASSTAGLPSWTRRITWSDLLPYALSSSDAVIKERGRDIAKEILSRANSVADLPLHPSVVAHLIRSKRSRRKLLSLRGDQRTIFDISFRDFARILAHEGDVPRVFTQDGQELPHLRELLSMIHDATTVLFSESTLHIDNAFSRIRQWPFAVGSTDPEVTEWLIQLRALAYAQQVRRTGDTGLGREALQMMSGYQSTAVALPILESVESIQGQTGPPGDLVGGVVSALGHEKDDGQCYPLVGSGDPGPFDTLVLRTLAVLIGRGKADLAPSLARSRAAICFTPTLQDIHAAEVLATQNLDDDESMMDFWKIVLDDIGCDASPVATHAFLRLYGRVHDLSDATTVIDKLSGCDDLDGVLAHHISVVAQGHFGTEILAVMPQNLNRRSALNETRAAATRMAAHADSQQELKSAAELLSRIGVWDMPTDDWSFDMASADGLLLFGRDSDVVSDFRTQMDLTDDRYSRQRAESAWTRYTRALDILSMFESGASRCTLEPTDLIVTEKKINRSVGALGTFTQPVLAQVLWLRVATTANIDQSQIPGLGNCGQLPLLRSGPYPQHWLGKCNTLWPQLLEIIRNADHGCSGKFAWIIAYHALMLRDKPDPQAARFLVKHLKEMRHASELEESAGWKRMLDEISIVLEPLTNQ